MTTDFYIPGRETKNLGKIGVGRLFSRKNIYLKYKISGTNGVPLES